MGRRAHKDVLATRERIYEFVRRRVLVNEEVVKLTPTEFQLLQQLALNAGKVLSHTECSAQECVDGLVAAALDGGGSDNVTVVLVRRH